MRHSNTASVVSVASLKIVNCKLNSEAIGLGEFGGLMRYGELARFALGGLWRQKVRTGLTLVGVTVGTCALAFSLSLGFGLRAFIEHEFKSRDGFWRVIVHIEEPPPDSKDVPTC